MDTKLNISHPTILRQKRDISPVPQVKLEQLSPKGKTQKKTPMCNLGGVGDVELEQWRQGACPSSFFSVRRYRKPDHARSAMIADGRDGIILGKFPRGPI